MNNYVSREMIIYLFNVLGLDESTIELGIKLSIKNNTPLPILLWSYRSSNNWFTYMGYRILHRYKL